jgi:hypothetical protein
VSVRSTHLPPLRPELAGPWDSSTPTAYEMQRGKQVSESGTGRHLNISARTVAHPTQHAYDKIRVSTRGRPCFRRSEVALQGRRGSHRVSGNVCSCPPSSAARLPGRVGPRMVCVERLAVTVASQVISVAPGGNLGASSRLTHFRPVPNTELERCFAMVRVASSSLVSRCPSVI